jgi:3-phosphoshikimate 1-carboxyvinyltransferase
MGAATAVRVPGDKSVTHRALVLAGLADGRSRLRGLLDSEDTRSTAAVLRALGVAVSRLGTDPVTVEGAGFGGLAPPTGELDCGNSGTTARLLLGVLAGSHATAVVTGDASLRRRPMRRVLDPLAAAGARFHELGAPDRLPVRVAGGVVRDVDHVNAAASAQVKSALLLAGLAAGVGVAVHEPRPSRDHTERLLAALGVPIAREQAGGAVTLTLPRGVRLRGFELDVPGDFSSAAFLLALGALGPAPVRVEGVGVNPTRTGFLDLLRRMGAVIEVTDRALRGGEPVATVAVSPGPLRAAHVEGDEVPRLIDELPLFAILAARAAGESTLRGAGELRFKETDRVHALVRNLAVLGVAAEELADGFRIRGSTAPLAGRISPLGDHRIAMAFGVLAAVPGNRIEVDDRDVVRVSYPAFWDALAAVAAPAAPR